MKRIEKAEIKVKALERILSKPLSNEERNYFENRLAVADAQLKKAKQPRLTTRQKQILETQRKFPEGIQRMSHQPFPSLLQSSEDQRREELNKPTAAWIETPTASYLVGKVR